MEEDILLHTFQKDETVELAAVHRMPTTVGNEIQDMEAQVSWVFTAREAGQATGETGRPAQENRQSAASPQTGGNGGILPWFILMLVSGSVFFFLLFKEVRHVLAWHLQRNRTATFPRRRCAPPSTPPGFLSGPVKRRR